LFTCLNNEADSLSEKNSHAHQVRWEVYVTFHLHMKNLHEFLLYHTLPQEKNILRFFYQYGSPKKLVRQAFFGPSQSEALIQIFHPRKDFNVPIHKNDVRPALVEISGGIVEGGVVINSPVRIADGEMRVIKRVIAVILNGPCIFFSEYYHSGGVINLGFFFDPGNV